MGKVPTPPLRVREWLLISVTTKAAPAAVRVQVWRKLRSLGAHYLQASVCLLPDQPAVRSEVERLLLRVKLEGGTSDCLKIALTGEGQTAHITGEFRTAVDIEYRELLDRIPSFGQELVEERRKGRLTYAEVEESEADLERFRRWLAKIEGRDYFGGALRAVAQAAVREAGQELEAFTLAALEAQTEPGATLSNRRRLSIVRDVT